MKYTLFLLSLIAVVGFTSCEKCADCTCTGDITFEFHDSISQSFIDANTSAYETSFAADYPAKSEEVCSKRSDYDATLEAWEANSYDFTENNKKDGYDWSVMGDYDCTCPEK